MARLRSRFAVALMSASMLGAVGVYAASAQVSVSPVVSTIAIRVAIPGQTPSVVTGYRVEVDCRNLPANTDGVVAVVSYPADGGSANVNLVLQATSSCAFRLIVNGSGTRSLFGNAITVGGALRAITFPTVVNGVTYDANTVLESEQIPLTASTSVLFGSLTTTGTVVVSPTTTTTVSPVTTSAPTTAAPTTTTRPPTTTAAPTTAAPTTTSAPVTVAPPTTSVPATPLVKIRGVVHEVFKASSCRVTRIAVRRLGSSSKRCATSTEARGIRAAYPNTFL